LIGSAGEKSGSRLTVHDGNVTFTPPTHLTSDPAR
jgi:hypothetical protein